jgi:WD40 repeat protein
VPFSYRMIDGGLHIVDACPADIGPTRVWPVEVPGARLILVAQRQDEVRRFDARTGEAVGDPGRPWRGGDFDFGCAAATVPDGRTIVAGAHHRGISRYDLLSGEAYPPTAGEQASTIWDVTTATLPGGRTVVAGAGYDGLVYRWDAATGERIGEPLSRHRAILKAVTTAVSADGAPMFISGSEGGDVLRWDAATGAPIGEPLPGPVDDARHLAVARLPGGRQILACVATYALHRWDLPSGEPLGPPVRVGMRADLVATHVDRHGTPSAFIWFFGGDDGGGDRVERWRLDTGEKVDISLPVTLRAVFGERGTWMVLGEFDGSLVVRPMPQPVRP